MEGTALQLTSYINAPSSFVAISKPANQKNTPSYLILKIY